MKKEGDHASSAAPSDDFAIDPLRIIDPITLQGLPVPQRRWLLDPWIPLGSVTAIYGDGGVGKSLLGQQLMTSCATGTPFLGMPVIKCRTFGVFCEDDEHELHRRQARINDKLGIEWGDLENMRWVSRVGSENLLQVFAADGRGILTPFHSQIVTAAQDMGAQLIILDTASDLFGGNENIRSMVRQFISSALMQIARGIDGSVVLLAHPSQSGRDSGRGDGGSTAWANSVRSRLYFRRLENENASKDMRILTRSKSNYAVAGDEITVAYEDGAFVRRDSGGSNALRAVEAEQAFLAGLRDLKAKNIRVNKHKGQANFAPRAMCEMTTIASEFTEAELAAAMYRLIKSERVRSVEEGPSSRRRSFIEITPTLGLDEPASNVVPFGSADP
jgi:RecA-family ATPase